MLKIKIIDQLFLRSWSIDDMNELASALKKNATHLKKWINWIKPNQNFEVQAKDFILEQENNLHQQSGFMLGLFQQDELIGMAGLQNWNHELQIAELGFWIAKNYTGKSIMASTLFKLIDFGFENMQLQKITAQYAIENNSAHNLLTKLGCKVEGVLRKQTLHNGMKSDLVLVGLLNEEWL